MELEYNADSGKLVEIDREDPRTEFENLKLIANGLRSKVVQFGGKEEWKTARNSAQIRAMIIKLNDSLAKFTQINWSV